MKKELIITAAALAFSFAAVPYASAVDFEYFKSQSCAELAKELDSLQKAESKVKEGIDKKESKANTQAVVTTLLIGWPFWGSTDHGDAHNMLSEIRTDLRFVTRAQKANKC